MPKRQRPDLTQPWPAQTRKHYIKLFSLQEQMRARLKMAQELAVHNLIVKYPGNIRKTNPIPVLGKQQPEDYLKKYQDEQLPLIRYFLSRMQGEIEQIKRAFTSGRRPNWYKQILKVEDLSISIWVGMDDIQLHLLLTLKGDFRAIKESNEVIINATRKVIKAAENIRKELLFLLPDQTILGPDEFGIFDTIIDLAPQPEPEPEERPFMDLTTTTLWQQDQRKKTKG